MCHAHNRGTHASDRFSELVSEVEVLAHTVIEAYTGIHPMLVKSWASVGDDEPTLKQHWVKVCCLHSAKKEKHVLSTSEQTVGIEPILGYCWASVADAGATLLQHRLKYRNYQIVVTPLFGKLTLPFGSMLGQCWASVADSGPALIHLWVDVWYLCQREFPGTGSDLQPVTYIGHMSYHSLWKCIVSDIIDPLTTRVSNSIIGL